MIYGQNMGPADEYPMLSHDTDNLPQRWSNGYIVAVESIYLGGEASAGWDSAAYVTVTLEANAEKLSREGALALALSQQ